MSMNSSVIKERLRCHSIVIKAVKEEYNKRTGRRSYPIGNDPYGNGGYYESVMNEIANLIMNPTDLEGIECNWVKDWPIEVYKTHKKCEMFDDGCHKEGQLYINFLEVQVKTYAFYCNLPMETVTDFVYENYLARYSLRNLKTLLENVEKELFLHMIGNVSSHCEVKEKPESCCSLLKQIEFDKHVPIFRLIDNVSIQEVVENISRENNKIVMLDRQLWDMKEDHDFSIRSRIFYYSRRLAFAIVPENFKIVRGDEKNE